MVLPGSWAEKLFEHYEHDSFITDDSPVKLLLGFSCACSGKRETWTTSLKNLKGSPPILQEFLKALREREETPGTSWYAYHQERFRQGMKEHAWRELIRRKISAIDDKLRKHVSRPKRQKLKSQKHRLMVLLVDDTIARSTKLYQQIVLDDS
jgi:hypothetical protein